MNYDGKIVRSVQNSPGGDVSDSTLFNYHQQGDVVWATYTGGGIRFGTLIAAVTKDGSLNMRYQHLDDNGVLKTGECSSTPASR